MKNLRYLPYMLCVLFAVAYCHVSVSGQSAEDRNRLANISASGSSVRWDVAAPHSGLTVTVSAPDGRVFRREFKAGASPEFMLTDKQGEKLPDGHYTYELRLTPVLSAGAKEALAKARGKDDDPEAVRAERKHEVTPTRVESGSFSILNGSVFVAGTQEEAGQQSSSKTTEQSRLSEATAAALTKLRRQHHFSRLFMPDQVIPDDLIVQGSACVGIDCVNNENFGFDTIRMKENNTRLQFDDTSATAGFATNNWQIRANSSASGGASFLAFVDQGATGTSETGTIVFEVDAGAPANSLKVSSLGRIGLRTATPVLDVHMNTSNTPAIRLEQNNSGGFTAQTWDVASNEANFFVRDVTSGSTLPFRIRPGAPTSSVDIAADGNVGIGTASPTRAKLQVNQASLFNSAGGIEINAAGLDTGLAMGADSTNNLGWIQSLEPGVSFTTRPLGLQPNGGRVGIGTLSPDQLLSVNGEASKVGGGSWAVFSDERLKTIKGMFNSGLNAVMQLQPLRYEYKRNNPLGINSEGEHVGFGAEALQKIIPEAVTRNSHGYLMVKNDPILWTMLNAIKEQQKEIEQLKAEVKQLRAASRRRR